jgi:LPS O-antigen subunit length determinant protein (WzzB/FepE family)
MKKDIALQMDMQEDEIDLRELFKVLLRYKYFIFLFTFVIAIGATVYAYSKTPIYEVKANIQLGNIGEKSLDSQENIIKVLSVIFNVDDKKSDGREFVSEISKINSAKNIPNFIEVVASAVSNDEANKKLKELLVYLQEMHKGKIEQATYDNKINIENLNREAERIQSFELWNLKKQIELLKEQDIAKIDEKINFLKTIELKSIETKIANHTKKVEEYNSAIQKFNDYTSSSKESTAAMIVSIQMVNYQNLILNSQNKLEELNIEFQKILKELIPQLEREKDNIQNETIRKLEYQLNSELPLRVDKIKERIEALQYEISPLKMKNHQVVGELIEYDYPVKPKKKLIVIVALVTAFVMAIFLVFLIDFFRKEREEKA